MGLMRQFVNFNLKINLIAVILGNPYSQMQTIYRKEQHLALGMLQVFM